MATVLATDPDADRVGIAVNHHGEYILPTGNEVGVLMLDYIAKQRIAQGTMPKKIQSLSNPSCPPVGRRGCQKLRHPDDQRPHRL